MDVNGGFHGKIIYRGPASHVSLPEGTWSLNMQNRLKTVFCIGFLFFWGGSIQYWVAGGMELYEIIQLDGPACGPCIPEEIYQFLTMWNSPCTHINKNIMTAPENSMCLSKMFFWPLYQTLSIITHRIHDGSMVLLYMVTWIPSIYPSHVSIYIYP